MHLTFSIPTIYICTQFRAGVGSEACPRDYLWIPGSVRSDRNAESNLQDRYCGPKLSDRNGDPQPGPVVGSYLKIPIWFTLEI